MPSWCPRCGRNIEEGETFCRQCGMPQGLSGEEATTWMLSNEPPPRPEQSRPTHPVTPNPTGTTTPPTGPAFVPPTPYYPPPPPVPYQPPQPVGPQISLGDWLSGGWQVYRENWALMSVASLLAVVLSACTLGVLAGPLLMGLFRMAFATMRGERPVMGDLFNWRGRFLQAFLTGLIFVVVPFWLSSGRDNPFLTLVILAATPFLSVMFGFVTSLGLERGLDVAQAVNYVGKTVFSRDAFMWWVVGLVFAAITLGGSAACGIGMLVTLPWIISSSAVAYRDVFGFDDPNRTLH